MRKQNTLKWVRFRGLQGRMALSYVWITAISALLLEVLICGILVIFTFTIFSDLASRASVRHPANEYAQVIASEARGGTLDPGNTYAVSKPELLIQGQPNEYNDGKLIPRDLTVIPTNLSRQETDQKEVPFILLIAPNGTIIDSSYPQHYPIGHNIALVLPERNQAVRRALRGAPENSMGTTPMGRIAYATQTIWHNTNPIGAIYVQAPPTPVGIDWLNVTFFSVIIFLLSIILLLFIIVPIGGVFGLITTRGLIERIRQLVTATTRFAHGEYTQHVEVGGKDEVGQLEQQFNRMAEQLAASIAIQKELSEQNARLAERSRISRELHDAISQDLFSLSMLAGGLQTALPRDSPLQSHATNLEQITANMTREMRTLLLELRPTQLEDLSLTECLQELATAYSTRLGISITADITPVTLDAKAEQALLRITQEALTNAVRHANASIITIHLKAQSGKIELSIIDNGKGFDLHESERSHGLGLRLMRERVQELSGTLQFQTAPGAGTSIHVSLTREDTHDQCLDR